MKIKYIIKRSLAYWIDCVMAFGIVMLVFQWAILSPLRESFGITEEWFEDSVNMHLYVLCSISIPVWLYFAYFDSKYSRGTFGKRLFKLKVVLDDGKKLSFWDSFFRTFLKLLPWEIAHLGVIYPTPIYYQDNPEIHILSYAGILIFLVYVISIFFSKNHQTMYDKLLNTRVK